MDYVSHTRGNTTGNNKPQAFLLAAPEDRSAREELAELLLSTEHGLNLCVWTADGLPGPEELNELGGISLFVMAVTERLAGAETETAAQAVRFCFDRNIPLLPVYYISPGSKTEPAGSFYRAAAAALGRPDGKLELDGPIHAAKDFKAQFSTKLRALMLSDETAEEVRRDAFHKQIFLSYRKADKARAYAVMEAIHDLPNCEAIAIWFDLFLPAGRDFNDEIRKQLLGSDAFALTVTENLTKPDKSGGRNYVQREEWPAAQSIDRDKHILVEAERSDHARLEQEMDPPVTGTIPIGDRGALRDAVERAGLLDENAQEPTTWHKYLLGLAYLDGLRVEKDEKRALRLLKEAAEGGCVEAWEQLGRMYLNGIGTRRDENEAIRHTLRAYELLMEAEATRENLRHLNRLFYDFNGLPLLLKANGRVEDANHITEAFLERLESSPYQEEDEFILCRVNALTDLANLFYEYDLDSAGTGRGGPSQSRLHQASQYAWRADSLLSRYQGDDTDLAEFLSVVVSDQYADLNKYKGMLPEAIRWKERSKERMEPLAERTGSVEHLERSFQISNNLGLFYLEDASQPRHTPEQRAELLRAAEENLDAAIRKARQLVAQDPQHNTCLADAYSNRVLATEDAGEKKAYALKAYEALLNAMKDLNVDVKDAWDFSISSEFSGIKANVYEFTDKSERAAIFEKVYRQKPPKPGASSLLLAVPIVLTIALLSLPFFGVRELVRYIRADNHVSYAVKDGTGVVRKVYGEDELVVLADSYRDTPVTQIAKKALYAKTAAKEIVLPAQLEKIGEYAFAGCTGITGLTLPESVTEIGDDAFRGCTRLRELTLPEGVTRIGKTTFYTCVSLERITIPASVTEIAKNAFKNCPKELVIVGVPGSEAQRFAEENFTFEPLAASPGAAA